MRPGQNKRMRNNNRPTNNRRGPNPLTRSYRSNGPDVKIRGNAHHVAEKYLQLARDAYTGGDPVAAENYLQHAEHYFRLIASAQAAQALAQAANPARRGTSAAMTQTMKKISAAWADRFASPSERAGGLYQQQQHGPQPQPSAAPNAPQPYIERQPFEADRQGPKDQGGFRKPTGPARESLSRPWVAARPSVRGAAGGLPRQSTGPRWTPTRSPAVPRRVATAGARRDRRGRRADKSSIVHYGRVKTGRRRNSRNSGHARLRAGMTTPAPDESDLATHSRRPPRAAFRAVAAAVA